MAELTISEIQEKMHQKQTSKIGEARVILFQNPNARKSIAVIEKEVPRKMPIRAVKKKKTKKPLQRQLEPEFNELEGRASQMESDNDELFKEGFDSYDVGSQRIDWDWRNRLKLMEAERRRQISVAT